MEPDEFVNGLREPRWPPKAPAFPAILVAPPVESANKDCNSE
jgi:hypothetical protein